MVVDHSQQPLPPDRDVMKALVSRAVATGGFTVGPLEERDQPQWAAELIRTFHAGGPKTRCPHLADSEQPSIWMALAPDLLACIDCEGELIRKIEARLGHSLAEEPSRCSVCGERAPVRGVSLAVRSLLLRALLCSSCEKNSSEDLVPPADGPNSSNPADQIPESLRLLDLQPIRIDAEALRSTTDHADFDEKGSEMLARAGKLSERVIAAVQRDIGATKRALDLDQAAIGGLLVRCVKLTRAIFDATQAEESEAHSTLSRSLAETTITLRWLVKKSDPASYRRFRADSLAQWRGFLAETEDTDEDAISRVLSAKMREHIEAELQAAGLTWDDIPAKPNSWGPPARQQFEDLGQIDVYNALFATHSSYVHPTWHEIRTFHLSQVPGGFHLDPSYAGMAPIAAFLLSRLVVEACQAAAHVLPHDLDIEALNDAVRKTVQGSQLLSMAFSEFTARGGLDGQLTRQSATVP